MSQSETADAAAALTGSILGEFASKFGDENAARMLTEMHGEPDVAPQPVVPAPVSGPPPAAVAAPAPPVSGDPFGFIDQALAPEAPEADEPAAEAAASEPESEPALFEPQLSDDLRELLEQPDFDEEARAEVEAEATEYDENYDPEVAAKLRAAEKRIAWLEAQNVQASKHRWIAENEKAYPVLATYAPEELRAIDATSRRAFAREAAKLNDRLTRILKPALDDLAAAKAQAKAEAETEARQRAIREWGMPAVEAVSANPAATAQQQRLAQARAERAPLHKRIKILMGGE